MEAREYMTESTGAHFAKRRPRVWSTPKPPPPAQRPRCPGCLKPRRPFVSQSFHASADVVQLAWKPGDWHGYGHFCTLNCAQRYANRRVDAVLGLRAGEPRNGLPPQ
jgi:hypothetical protein